MDRFFYGEYDGYDYRPVEEMTLQEQIGSAEKALAAAKMLSQTRPAPYWDEKIMEIQKRIQQLEHEKEGR